MERAEEKKAVCVTGAGGFIASWLVKLLLSKGYTVHATVRDPSSEKNAHLKKLDNASEYLRLFKVDLLDYDSVEAAIAGCAGVFHVASPVPASKVLNPEVELIAPAVNGTQNVLKACTAAKIKRVVVVSSVAAVLSSPNWPKDKLRNEECWSDKDYCKKTENWYSLSKTLAEADALDYASKYRLDVVTVLPAMVFGPLLQSTVNSSSLFILNLLNGNRESVDNSGYHYVDVRDLAEALLLVYEKQEASGRYICAPHKPKVREIVEMLKSKYPHLSYPKNFTDVEPTGAMTSEKLKALGWECRALKDTLIDTVEYYKDIGILKKD